ncbi:flagellar hook assembly protein FlgD [Rubinisphaera sp. JC750]|uniref:flagellar hook assembly protein FlgD n=1 Tax=Rubinisphaera sp. JC750 TaxID=2898658 RepID=UPI001F463AA9|nr:flagellar hook capping FlgD N-terminal domain-containing protein [Rubinisphaera sp. JC750]
MAVIDTVYSPTGQPVQIVDGNDTGFNALDPEAFLKLMIVQLQNQDPTEPTSNEELLNQISTMRSLQSSIELEDMIASLANSQTSSASANFASSAAGLIGHSVTGTIPESTDEEGETIPAEEVEGIVERAILRDGKAYVTIGDKELPVENIASVTWPQVEA